MLSAQYLTTSPSAHDRRVLFVALSEKGTKLHQAMEEFFQKQEHALNQEGFSCERWKKWFEESRHLIQLHHHCGANHQDTPALSSKEGLYPASHKVKKSMLVAEL
jgi:hypothetical protein